VTPTARWAAFQDLTQDARLLVDGGEHAFAEVVARGTHTVPLAAPDGDIASTGRAIECRSASTLPASANVSPSRTSRPYSGLPIRG
jgi:hypothetical protein